MQTIFELFLVASLGAIVVLIVIIVFKTFLQMFPTDISSNLREMFCKHEWFFDHKYQDDMSVGDITTSDTKVVYKCKKCSKPRLVE